MPRNKKSAKYSIRYRKAYKVLKWLAKFKIVLYLLKLRNAIKRRKWYRKVVKISIKLWVLMNEKRYRATGKISLDDLNSIVYYARNKAPAPISELKITHHELIETYQNLKHETRSKKLGG